jgi:uncharacterized protein (DUF486 family)
MAVLPQTTLLLVLSNIFMTFAWYAHLRVPPMNLMLPASGSKIGLVLQGTRK